MQVVQHQMSIYSVFPSPGSSRSKPTALLMQPSCKMCWNQRKDFPVDFWRSRSKPYKWSYIFFAYFQAKK